MKQLFCLFVLCLGVLWFQVIPGIAKSTGRSDDFPSYVELKKGVENLPTYVQELKRLRKSLQRVHGEFSFPFRTCDSKDTSFEKAVDALAGIINQITLQRENIGYVVVKVFSLSNIDATKYGWTLEQIAEAKKWKKNVLESFEDVAKINNIGPTDVAAEDLLKSLADHVSECNKPN